MEEGGYGDSYLWLMAMVEFVDNDCGKNKVLPVLKQSATLDGLNTINKKRSFITYAMEALSIE